MVTKLDKVDVVTVGVGWGGSIVATELTKAGFNVVGLEQGGERSLEDYSYIHDEIRYGSRKELLHSLSNDTVTFRNDKEQTARPLRGQIFNVSGDGVGGGGTHYAGQMHRYFPYDFEIHSKTVEKYGENKIPEELAIRDWGITYDELEPYYDKMEKTSGVSGEQDHFAGERSNDYPTPPMKKSPAMNLFETATKKMKYHPFVIPGGNATESYTTPDGYTYSPCQYCSFCTFYACEMGAKADPGVVLVPVAKKTGKFDLRTHSLVKRVLYSGDKATGVIYMDTRTGEEFEQPADLVVLTSYTFNNMRLLLLSEIGKPYDPATGKGVIGRNFTDHHFSLGARGFFEEEKFNLYAGAGILGMALNDYNADNFDHAKVDFIHGAQIEIRQDGALPASMNYVPSDVPAWGEEFKKKSIHYAYRNLRVSAHRVSLPAKSNFIDLDPTYKDSYGDPLLRITYDYNDNDRKIAEFIGDKTAEILEEMGADIIEKNPLPEHHPGMFMYQHSGGGVTLGTDPETSAVNTYLQMWDMDNLFVCGASAFPAFGSTNPTLTMGALTYRATEGMIEYLKNGGGQLVEAKKSSQLV